MASSEFNQIVLQSPHRLAMPIATYPGLSLTGATVRDVVTNPRAQFDIQAALHQRNASPFALSAMDLSAEAEAFGCELAMSDTEIPTVTGSLVARREQADRLPVPQPGDRRTGVYLEAVRLLRQLPNHPFVLGGCIGPFSLASRLVGVTQAMEMTVTEPALVHALLEKSSAFLAAYVAAFRAAGAQAVLMAEPAAGLLSPRGIREYSSPYIRQIAAAATDTRFTIVLHNCAARLLHLDAIRETGLGAFHFGAPMDLVTALRQVPGDLVLCGNLDPAAVFVNAPPGEVSTRTRELLSATASHPHYVISSGCDLPPDASLASLDAFYSALR